MIRKFTVIIAVGFFLIAAANLFADEKGDEENTPALQQEFESRQPGDLQQAPRPAEPGRQPAARRRVRELRNNQVEVEVVTKRIRADRQQPPVRQQATQRPGRIAQLQNRWFNALKEAYREGDMDRVGRLIRRMEQFRKQVPNRIESAQQIRPLQQQIRPLQQQIRPLQQQIRPLQQQIRPLQQQRYRQSDEGYQPRGPMRNFRGQRRDRGPVEQAQAFRGQRPQAERRRLRMQDMPDRQLQRPVAPPEQGYRENCNCEKCRQARARQQRQLGRQGVQGRGPGRFGPYEEDGLQQRRLRQRRGWQQQEPPRQNVQEDEELDFDWDW